MKRGMSTAEVVRRQRRPVTYTAPHREHDLKHVGGVNAIEIENTNVLHTGGRDGTVRTWDLSMGMPKCVATREGHGDWVTDLALVTPTLLASASSDHTVRLWKTDRTAEEASTSESGSVVAVLQGHSDHVMGLARASDEGVNVGKFASGGLNREIFLWDIERCCAINISPSYLSVKNDQCVTPLTGSKESIYALAMDGTGNVLVSGGTELALRVWDTRSAQKQGKLKGHSDNVRAIVVDGTGRKCVTASSDRTIRLWDIGEQRCVQTFAGMHTGSIWALAANSEFSRVYSGGSDSRICSTSLRDRRSNLIAADSAAVLKLCLDETHSNNHSDGDLWTATASRSMKRWSANVPNDEHNMKSTTMSSTASLSRHPGVWFEVGSSPSTGQWHGLGTPKKMDNWGDTTAASTMASTTQLAPTMEIHGASPIVRHAVLHNKRQILSQDSVGSISLWDVATGRIVQNFDGVSGGSDFDELLQSETWNPNVGIPSWFTVNARSGSLEITLAPSSAFQAEAYATDLGIANASVEERRNLGVEIIRLLMDDWAEKFGCTRTQRRAFIDPLPSSSSILFSHPISGNGRVCVKASDLVGNPEEREALPKWFVDHALNQAPEPESPKIPFTLVPAKNVHPSEYEIDVADVTPSSVMGPKILGTKKITDYVAHNVKRDASAIELVCAGVVITGTAFERTLAGIHAHVWKTSPPVVIEYRVKKR